jgi:hypothetical protein
MYPLTANVSLDITDPIHNNLLDFSTLTIGVLGGLYRSRVSWYVTASTRPNEKHTRANTSGTETNNEGSLSKSDS